MYQSPAEESPSVVAVGSREDGELLVRRQELVPALGVLGSRLSSVGKIRTPEDALGIGELKEADELAARGGHRDVEVCCVRYVTVKHAQKSLTSCLACSSDVAFCICATFGWASICRMRVCWVSSMTAGFTHEDEWQRAAGVAEDDPDIVTAQMAAQQQIGGRAGGLSYQPVRGSAADLVRIVNGGLCRDQLRARHRDARGSVLAMSLGVMSTAVGWTKTIAFFSSNLRQIESKRSSPISASPSDTSDDTVLSTHRSS